MCIKCRSVKKYAISLNSFKSWIKNRIILIAFLRNNFISRLKLNVRFASKTSRKFFTITKSFIFGRNQRRHDQQYVFSRKAKLVFKRLFRHAFRHASKSTCKHEFVCITQPFPWMNRAKPVRRCSFELKINRDADNGGKWITINRAEIKT